MKKSNLSVLLFWALCAGVICSCSKDDAEENEPKVEQVADSGITDGHAWVNLGLPSGTLWATCNVGASKPEEYGSYFAWGETQPKNEYSWKNYKFISGSKLTKYCVEDDDIYFWDDETDSYCDLNCVVDDKIELEPADDAATANWGNNWQMPSTFQIQELLTYCHTTKRKQNGVDGVRIKSYINGNSIFFPGEECYWTRMLSDRSNGRALNCRIGDKKGDDVEFEDSRWEGMLVRPVRKK